MGTHRHRLLLASWITMLTFGQGVVHASGFNIPEISIAGLGTSNALAANHPMLGAVPYNPSLASFHGGTTITGGLTLVHAESEVTTATPNVATTTGFQGRDNVFLPNLSLTHQLNEKSTLAFNVSVPLGLSTDFPAGTFSSLGTGSPTKSQVEVIDFAPSVAFKVNQGTSIAVGIDYYWVCKVAFDTTSLQNKGDGDGWGWNISASHIAGPWSFGASFRSHVEADISGETRISTIGTFGGTATTLDIPWRAQAGVRYQFNPELALEADITRVGWSSFDVLSIATTTPAGTITSENHWDDTNAYRVGGTYQLNGDTELRFGYTFDKTGMPDSFYSARTSDADRHLFSIGLEKRLGDGLAIEAGYMLAKFNDESFRGTRPFTGDPNGTFRYNGDYETTVHLFGIGLNKTF